MLRLKKQDKNKRCPRYDHLSHDINSCHSKYHRDETILIENNHVDYLCPIGGSIKMMENSDFSKPENKIKNEPNLIYNFEDWNFLADSENEISVNWNCKIDSADLSKNKSSTPLSEKFSHSQIVTHAETNGSLC